MSVALSSGSYRCIQWISAASKPNDETPQATLTLECSTAWLANQAWLLGVKVFVNSALDPCLSHTAKKQDSNMHSFTCTIIISHRPLMHATVPWILAVLSTRDVLLTGSALAKDLRKLLVSDHIGFMYCAKY